MSTQENIPSEYDVAALQIINKITDYDPQSLDPAVRTVFFAAIFFVGAMKKIADLEGAPAEKLVGDERGHMDALLVEQDCHDKYDGAELGYQQGVEKCRKWAMNEALRALESVAAILSAE